MDPIVLRGFMGIFPKLDADLLPVGAATVARNVLFRSGALTPARSNRRVSQVGPDARGLIPLGTSDPFPAAYPCRHYLNGMRTLFTEEKAQSDGDFAGLRYSYNSHSDRTQIPPSFSLAFPAALEATAAITDESTATETLSSTYAVSLRTKWADEGNLHVATVSGTTNPQLTYKLNSTITVTVTRPDLDDDLGKS